VLVLSFQGPSASLVFPLRDPSFLWFDELFSPRRTGDVVGAFGRSLPLAVMVMGLTVLLAVLVIVANTDWGREQVRRVAIGALEGAVAGDAAGDWDYDLSQGMTCPSANDPAWIDDSEGAGRVYAKAIAYHVTGEERYAAEVRLPVLQQLVAAAQEERFTRKKHDSRFPENAVEYCLAEGGIDLDQVDHIAFYDKPFLKFERLLETYLAFAPKGFTSFRMAVPVWLKEKLFQKRLLRDHLVECGAGKDIDTSKQGTIEWS
jgi:hypothetical protein